MSYACVSHVTTSVTCRHRARHVSSCVSSCITEYHTCQMSPCGSHQVCRKSSCMSRAVVRVTRLCTVVVQSQCVCVCGAAGRDTIQIACDVIMQVMRHGAYHMSSIRVMYISSHISHNITSCMRIVAHITRQCIPHTSHVITHPGLVAETQSQTRIETHMAFINLYIENFSQSAPELPPTSFPSLRIPT